MLIELEGTLTVTHTTVRRLAAILGVPYVTGAAGLVDALEASVVGFVMGKGGYTPNASNWCGLSSTTPTDAGGSFTEPSAGAYARVQTQGTTATGVAWSTPTGTAPAYVENSAVITFPAATADWVSGANLTHFGLFTASTAGTLSIWGALTTPKPVLNGDTASFAAAAIRVQMGDPGDTYT
jgi:hypothetical protein